MRQTIAATAVMFLAMGLCTGFAVGFKFGIGLGEAKERRRHDEVVLQSLSRIETHLDTAESHP